ncbi:unnamed protein product [Moneuplotes crassus]|uniref:Histone-lysine N-methyltransferase, H3 lysine-79 specific n=1 Tax=Euplotes crassus TaxID=5936 RepID=A0AAD1UAD9_EUPCR|nr:unnamed protein product [Moneuplotes crassus]
MEGLHTELEPGNDVDFIVGHEQLPHNPEDPLLCTKYFSYDHTGSEKSIRLNLKGLTRDSDGAIFVSTTQQKPSYTTSKWKGTKYGAKHLEIHTCDGDYKQGIYYVAVSGNRKMKNELRLSLTLIEPIEITQIDEGIIEGEIGIGENSIKHHFFQVRKIDNLKLEIHISPGFPKCVAYLSNKNAHLPIRECDWAVGLFKNDELSKDIYKNFEICNPFYVDHDSKKVRYDPTLRSISTEFGDLSTLELVKIRHRSTLKLKLLNEYEEKKRNEEEDKEQEYLPLAHKCKQFEVSEETIDKNMDAVIKNLREDLIELNQSGDNTPKCPYIVCLDVDAFKFSKGFCYLTLENLSGEEMPYKIEIIEKHEFDICDKHTQKLNQIHNHIFSQVNPSQVSHKERERLNLNYLSQYTYGEVEFRHFYPVLNIIKPKKGEVFWDIGCGACKPMIIAAMCFPVLKAVKGVEYVDGVYELGKQNIEILHEEMSKNEGLEYCKNIEIQHGDLLKTDWSDADILYVSSVCFSDEMLEGINEMSNDCKIGSRMITLKLLPENPNWTKLRTFRAKMSWGPSEVYIFQKTT